MPAIVSPTVDAFFSAPVDAGKIGSSNVAQDGETTESQFQNLMLGILGQQAGDPKTEIEGAGQQSIQTSTTQTDASLKGKDGKALRSKGTTQDDSLGVAAAASIIVPSTMQIIAQAVMPKENASSAAGSDTTDGESTDVLQCMTVSAASAGQSDMPVANEVAEQAQAVDAQKSVEIPVATASDENETAKASDNTRSTDIPMAPTKAHEETKVGADTVQTAATQISKESGKTERPASWESETPVAVAEPEVNEQDSVSTTDSNTKDEGLLNTSLSAGGADGSPTMAVDTTSQKHSDGGADQGASHGNGRKQLKSDTDPKAGASDPAVMTMTGFDVAQRTVSDKSTAFGDNTDASASSAKTNIESIGSPKAKSSETDAISSDSQAVLAASHNKIQIDVSSAASAASTQSTSAAAHANQTMSTRMINQIVKSAKLQTFENGAGMTLRLDPPHLGSVQMNISTHNGMVTADLQTSTVTAKQMLESDLSALKKSLSDAGVNVDTISVSVGGNTTQSGGFQDHSAREYQENWRSLNSGFYQSSSSIDSTPSVMAAARPAAGQLDFLA